MLFYDELQQRTEEARLSLLNVPLIQAGARGEITLPQYVAFLTQAYHHVKHTVPLMMACGSRLGGHQEWLREALAEYIEEEIGHQEWILNDIAACGADAEAVRHGRPNFSTEMMVAYAYDAIARGNPVSFFGMVNVLEGTSIALATSAARAIQTSLGLPNKAFSYLLSHGDLDIGHVDFFRGLMNRIECDTDKAAIVHSARAFYRLYGDIFREVERCSPTLEAA
ncbi:TenA family transcriptional regulator [Microbulbifer hydrolyticus]|uniref:Biliverdin-producing heme oxygenase n=1 Tax=Microbulbifer hydrolyticus TaxID=48074 RepID=A0A6P1TBV5_9GAMM|nr:iron-containing redox enzyme family protein [Microbulbifer hydrolyticus]MBB5212647.1 pyrroloquinoline quinone (PQQ) biosynthesis protein C [Microbulbifer hydrolyticus]QHQ40248.1 biliverdin-producing heme oxygenase [Microbulbifer hydrolyticus]